MPGDKSISHRAAMLAALARGACRISNFNTGADCASTLRCLAQLGVVVTREGGATLIEPVPFRSPQQPLDCGNSGSTIRMLTGLLAGQNIPATLTGDASLARRPMKRVAEPLRQMGAVIHLRDEEYAPLVLESGVTRAVTYTMPVSSAQVKSAVLLAGLRLPGTAVLEPVPSRDHTERMLEHLNFYKHREIRAFAYDVPADPSTAAFFVVGALLEAGSDVFFPQLLVNPFRTAYLRILKAAGARIEVSNERLLQNEPVADVRVLGGGKLTRIEIKPDEVPAVIDEIPVLSLLGTVCGFSVSGAKELRSKESDRIHAMVSNLRMLGVQTTEREDGFDVEPGTLNRAKVTTFGDHRIAMTFAIAGMELDDPACVSVSFPEFFTQMNTDLNTDEHR